MSKGVWHVTLPAALDGVAGPLDLQFPTRNAVFSASRFLICFCSWLFSLPWEMSPLPLEVSPLPSEGCNCQQLAPWWHRHRCTSATSLLAEP
jgi:hypothetical protein